MGESVRSEPGPNVQDESAAARSADDQAPAAHLPTAEHWDAQADDWARWARAEGHDSYWSFHGARFHSLVPPPNPGAIALDLACGEGRVSRRLQADGWVVAASDYGRRLCGWTRSSGIDATACASAAAVPFRSSSIDLVTVFMGFHDFDDPVMDTAFDEVARILKPGGSAVIGINHPVHSFLDAQRVGESGLHFSVKHSYFGPVAYENVVRREGLELRFRGVQRPLQAYLDGFMSAGLLLDRFEEVTVPDALETTDAGAEPSKAKGSPDWAKIPMFVDLRFVKPH